MKIRKKKIILPASLLKKTIAFLIDIFIIDFLLFWPFNKSIKEIMNAGIFSKEIYILASVLSFIAILYFTVFEYSLLQTPGKMLVKIRMKQEYNFFKLFLSNIFLIPLFPFFILWPIEFFYMLFSKKNQRLLEKLLNIEVVEEIVL